MVSFYGNIANEQRFPIGPRSRNYRRRADFSAHSIQRSRDWLVEITVVWDHLLSSIGEIQPSTTAHFRDSREVIWTHPDLSKVVISILNRFQLLIWLYESQAENLDNKEKFEAHLFRMEQSIQRDLIRLRKLVNQSSFQSRLTLRTADLAGQLEAFFRRFCP